MKNQNRVIGGAAVLALSIGMVATAVAPATATGPETTYIVLAPQGKSTAAAAGRVTAAGGTVVADYSKIGVLVATSTNTAFTQKVAGAGVEGVASTAGLGTTLIDDEALGNVDAGALGVPGDPTKEPLWNLQWDMQQIDVAEAHAVTTGDPSIVVGVLDSGIAASHPDLATQVAKDKSASCIGGVANTSEAAWSPMTSDHGTHVAGTIAAAINGVGIAGVAPGVKVASVKVVNDEGFIYPEAAICGFMWAAEHDMPITNNSYFIDPWEFNCVNDPDQRAVWLAVQRALRYSSAQGTLTVASAGNSNVDLQHKFVDSGSPNDGSAPVEDRTINGACRDLPAEAPGVVTVSAVGTEQLKSYYSSYGQGVVDVAAPGGDSRQPNPNVSTAANTVLSTTYNTTTGALGWGYKQGTSMAGPHAAGVAALALSAHPDMTVNALASFLERTATPLPCPDGVYNPRPTLPVYQATCTGGDARNGFYGAGNVNAFNVVK
jgi:subtilisin family serine protease